MKQNTSDLHTLHFKMDTELKHELRNLDLFIQVGSLSTLIVEILRMIASFIQNDHFSGKQMESQYKFINDDLNIERESVHVYMPVYMYKWLKLMHQDLNCYSIAQLLRGFLWFFIGFVREHGDNYLAELNKSMSLYSVKNEKLRISQEILIQLIDFINQNSKIIRYFNIYNNNCIPIKMYFI